MQINSPFYYYGLQKILIRKQELYKAKHPNKKYAEIAKKIGHKMHLNKANCTQNKRTHLATGILFGTQDLTCTVNVIVLAFS